MEAVGRCLTDAARKMLRMPNVDERSIKEKLPPRINRRDNVVKVLYEEMAKFVGQDQAKVEIQPGTFRKIMLVGIQGTGKTTSSVKLARFYGRYETHSISGPAGRNCTGH